MKLFFDVLKYMFGSWQMGVIAIVFLLMFPLVFLLASLKPKVIKRRAGTVSKKAKTNKPVPRKKAEEIKRPPDDNPEGDEYV